MLRSSQEIIDAAKAFSHAGTRPRISVAAAQDADVLGAVRSCYDDGICDATLFGDTGKINELIIVEWRPTFQLASRHDGTKKNKASLPIFEIDVIVLDHFLDRIRP